MLKKFADFFNVSTDYLLGRTDKRSGIKYTPGYLYNNNRITGGAQNIMEVNTFAHKSYLPLIGTIRAGIPLLAEENWVEEVSVPDDMKADFALRVSEDSMAWAGILTGDIALLSQANVAELGK